MDQFLAMRFITLYLNIKKKEICTRKKKSKKAIVQCHKYRYIIEVAQPPFQIYKTGFPLYKNNSQISQFY